MNTLVNERIVNSLFNEHNFNTELKAMLNQMIDEELEKEMDEMDCDLIEECTNMLIELEQQDDDGFAVIIPLISSEKIMANCAKSRFGYLSRGLRASIIAAVILFSAFTANMVIAKVFDYNIAQEVIDTITEKLSDWGFIASADNGNEVTIDSIPYDKSDKTTQTKPVSQPEQKEEKPIKNTVNRAPPKNNTVREKKTAEPETNTDNTANPPMDEPVVNQTYTLTFEIKDDDSYKFSKTVTYGQPIGELPVVSKAGYEFAGWYNADISYYREHGRKYGTPLKSTTIYNLDSDAVAVAKWNRLVTVNLYPTGGICDTESMQISYYSKVMDLPVPVREGYVFLGWFDAQYNQSYTTTKDLYTEAAGDGFINLFALWIEAGEVRTVTFDPGDGTCDVKTKDYIIGKPYGELPTPTRSGYHFLGWGVIVDPDTFEYIIIDENTVFDRYDYLYAGWYRTKATVTFDADGGVCDVENRTVYSDNFYGKLPTPVKTGYEFVCWYNTDTFEPVANYTIVPENVKNHTLKALWKPVDVRINFSANGGVMNTGGDVSLTKSYSYMQPFGTLPGASRVGYRFTGWYTEPNGGDKIEDTDVVDFLDTVVYYAHWERDEEVCVVTFHSNDSKDNNSVITFKTGDEMISSKAPDMSHMESILFSFTGWYTDKYYGEKVDVNMIVTENMELYAHWCLNPQYTEYSLVLEKSEYEINEKIDPSTISMIIAVPLTGHTETITPEMLAEVNAVYTYDTSKPGRHTLTVTAAADAGYVVTLEASAEIRVGDCQHDTDTKIINRIEPTCTQEGYTGDTICCDCGELIASGEAIEKAPHNIKEIVIKKGNEHGNGEIAQVCKVCGEQVGIRTIESVRAYIPDDQTKLFYDGTMKTPDVKVYVTGLGEVPEYEIVMDDGRTEPGYYNVYVIVNNDYYDAKIHLGFYIFNVMGTPELKVTAQKGGFTAEWNSIENASGYEIEYYRPIGYDTTQNVFCRDGTQYEATGLKRGFYYVRIRAYQAIYLDISSGEWSEYTMVYVP